uniref:F-box domain-containing protein n=1 Tax=Mycena chlorophos TaxID=658473 RepID=A0ABQ0LLV3_MYCCL|nr:predicted protein [Mycena chlorophos]
MPLTSSPVLDSAYPINASSAKLPRQQSLSATTMSPANALNDLPVELLDRIVMHAFESATYTQPTLCALMGKPIYPAASHQDPGIELLVRRRSARAPSVPTSPAPDEILPSCSEYLPWLDRQVTQLIHKALGNMKSLTSITCTTESASYLVIHKTFPALRECCVHWIADSGDSNDSETAEFFLRHPLLRKIQIQFDNFGAQLRAGKSQCLLPDLEEYEGLDTVAPILLHGARSLQRLRLHLDKAHNKDPMTIFQLLAGMKCPLVLVEVTMHKWDTRLASAIALHGRNLKYLVLTVSGYQSGAELDSERDNISRIDDIIGSLPSIFCIRIDSTAFANSLNASLDDQLAFELGRVEVWRHSAASLGICILPSCRWMYVPLVNAAGNPIAFNRWFPVADNADRNSSVLDWVMRELPAAEIHDFLAFQTLLQQELKKTPDQSKFIRKMRDAGKYIKLWKYL